MSTFKDRINHLVALYHGEMQEVRHYLHQHAELSFEETRTSAYVAATLEKYGITRTSTIVETGVLGIIECNNPSKKTIALRADMDALPIQELNTVAYKSVHDGVMHACGHDVHMACLLGAARVLNDMKDELEGTILLIFQPGEEKLPGGAKLMLESGIFNNSKPDLIIAQHVLPTLDAGKVAFRPGKYMASCDEIYITVKGKGGHGAMPHQLNDTVLIASHIVVALQQIASRYADASIPTVLSFGRFIANGITNVIPNEVVLEGTFRTLDETWRHKAHEHIISIAKSIAQGMGADCDVFIDKGYPVLTNHPAYTTQAMQYAMDYLGEGNVEETGTRMTAEDFAYFSLEYPSFLYRLGTSDGTSATASPLHSPTFNINENAIATGMGMLSWLTVKFLG